MTNINNNLKREVLNPITHAVRSNQIVLQYGVGAMIDFPDQTLMTADTSFWKDSELRDIHDERLEKLLNVNSFKTPKGKDEAKEGLPFVRFPEWYFCPKCRRFKPLNEWYDEYKAKTKHDKLESDPYMIRYMRCPSCKQELVVTRIITVCENGHIDDFPWVKWVHCCNSPKPREICSEPKLFFRAGNSATEGLEGLSVTCQCGASASLKNAFKKEVFEELDKIHGNKYRFRCRGSRPWKHDCVECSSFPRTVQRGSSSVYYPVISSSLVIPPYSDNFVEMVENNPRYMTLVEDIDQMSDALKEEYINFTVKSIANQTGIDKNIVEKIVRRKLCPENETGYSTMSSKYRAEEYKALKYCITGSGSFVGEVQDITKYHLPTVSHISLISKVREVQALIGFTRINPAEKSTVREQSDLTVSVKEEKRKWYPACEVRGEGIFIEFDNVKITEWLSRNPELQKRVNLINDNYNRSTVGRLYSRHITAKFLLLHTLSHLILKQMSFECGYNVASLKERIYCSDASDGIEMSGILIYTSSGDSEGTLGGLVRQGMSDVFPDIFRKAINSARSCSNDPICSLSEGQGREALNLAACHVCTLLPETTCEEFNILLDRGVIVGTIDNPKIGFYENYPVYSDVGKTLSLHSTGNLTNSSFIDIWDDLLQWGGADIEKQNWRMVKEHLDEYSILEDPFSEVEFEIAETGAVGKCNLVWPKAKIMLFIDENLESLNIAQGADWKLYNLNDVDFSWRLFLNDIGEEV